jgi:hypothetical protein
MAEQRVERRLAAILAGDVAGYSRLMGADEEGTLARLNAHRREFLEPTIAEHRGRIVKRTGDGILIEFSSAVDATRCAIQQQRGMAQRNAGVAADERIELRIGIHVGDIMIEEGDIFGDGVMFIVFAARLSTPLQLTGVARVRRVAERSAHDLAAHPGSIGALNDAAKSSVAMGPDRSSRRRPPGRSESRRAHRRRTSRLCHARYKCHKRSAGPSCLVTVPPKCR